MIEIGVVYNLPISAFPATEPNTGIFWRKPLGNSLSASFFSLSSTDPLPGAQ
jgi:hypothetical protein